MGLGRRGRWTLKLVRTEAITKRQRRDQRLRSVCGQGTIPLDAIASAAAFEAVRDSEHERLGSVDELREVVEKVVKETEELWERFGEKVCLAKGWMDVLNFAFEICHHTDIRVMALWTDRKSCLGTGNESKRTDRGKCCMDGHWALEGRESNGMKQKRLVGFIRSWNR